VKVVIPPQVTDGPVIWQVSKVTVTVLLQVVDTPFLVVVNVTVKEGVDPFPTATFIPC
jgi:hypothetical protein